MLPVRLEAALEQITTTIREMAARIAERARERLRPQYRATSRRRLPKISKNSL